MDEEMQKDSRIEDVLNSREFQKLNHIERLDLIDKNPKLCEVYYRKFKENMEKEKNMSFMEQNLDTDKNIHNSLLENYNKPRKEKNIEVPMEFLKDKCQEKFKI